MNTADTTLFGRILGYIRSYYWIFIISVLGSVLYSAVDAAMIRFLQPLIDDAFVNHDPKFIALIPIIIPAAFVLRGSMSFVSSYGMLWVARQVVATMRQQMFEHLQRLPASYFDSHPSGQLLSKILYNVEQVAKASTDVITDGIRSVFLICFLLGVMLVTSWRLTLIFMLAAPIVVIAFKYVNQRFRGLSRRIQTSMAHVTQTAEENISAQREVKIFGAQAFEANNFAQLIERNRIVEMKLALAKGISEPAIQMVGGIGMAACIYVATTGGIGQTLSAGAFAAFISAIITLQKPLKEVTNLAGKVQQGLAGAESVFGLLDEAPEQDSGSVVLNKAKGQVKFEQVSFQYPSSVAPVLQDLNFEVEAGETVAIVGPSGGGKTSLVALLAHFYADYSGTISIDGVSIRDITLSSLRDQLAIVSQHVTLFDDTVANNIAYGRRAQVSQADIEHAARLAYAAEFIEKLPQGYNTQIGENGVLLSGGQRQRMAIARALCKGAPILILDEATSALDPESERAIQQALAGLMHQHTIFVIAHRLSTIENADKILVIEGGKIVEMGSHQQLLQQQGRFAQLHRLHYSA